MTWKTGLSSSRPNHGAFDHDSGAHIFPDRDQQLSPRRRGGDLADAGNGHQPLGRLVCLDQRRKLAVDRSDRLVERVDLTDKRTKRDAHVIGDDDLAILVETVGGHALQAIGMLRALRRDEADLGSRDTIQKRNYQPGPGLKNRLSQIAGGARRSARLGFPE